ncbi:MAG TPA: flagellar basal body P-ring formation chaperone FlgA [Verrucomicrobiae bacterium]|nr:flagellar basal body P-ring formation chaperone FlgA [Verrucomicrobiae bacterium]
MIPILMFAAAAVQCHAVDGDRIRGADLAAAAPVFSALPSDLTIGFAPQPGTRRLIEPFDLARIAKVNGILDAGALQPICFERAMAPLDPAAAEAAMRRALDAPDAHIEIVELSKFPAPKGEIVFPRTALNEPASDGPATWNGQVNYDGGRFPIWARVRITVHQKRVVAMQPLRPGNPIPAGDVQLQEVDEFPHSVPPLASLDQVVGRIPRRWIAAGSPVMPNAIDQPNDIDSGQTVVVEVRSGAAVVTIEAQAESAGRRGDMVSLRNPVSGKTFRARIEEKGRAFIDCQPMEIAQ